MSKPAGQLPSHHTGSLRLDLLSGYVLAFSRVAAWAGVSAYVYREQGAMMFGMLALLRSTISLISYTSLGIGPAMVHAMSQARSPAEAATPVAVTPLAVAPPAATPEPPTASPIPLDYAQRHNEPGPVPGPPELPVFVSGTALARLLAVAGLLAAAVLHIAAPAWFAGDSLSRDAVGFAASCLGVGVAIRVGSEPSSAVLQVRGRLYVDSFILASGEIAWLALVLCETNGGIGIVALMWLATSMFVSFARFIAVQVVAMDLAVSRSRTDWSIVRGLLVFGGLITIAQAADFLYAPTDYLILNWLLSSEGVAAYAPAVQIDAALLLAVAGIAAALFPRAARAHARGDRATLRRLYLRGTLASFALLLVAAAATMLLSEWILTLWLGAAPSQTIAILPLVLVHTVVGGASGVGRAVLLGMGRVRAFTASVLSAGVANVVLSVILAGPMGLGLTGVVIATIVVVIVRCAIWMPWYVWRMTGRKNDE